MKKTKIWLTAVLTVLALVAVGLGGWLYYDANVDRSGWDDRGSYRDFHGDPVTGWQDIDGSRYYFAQDQLPVKAWQTLEGSRYYFDEQGVMATSWRDMDGGRFYFGADGVMVTSWQDIDGKRYCFAGDGQLLTHWQDMDGSRYYFGTDGVMATGEVTVEEKRYCFREDGTMVTGWENGRYYLAEGGSALGWQEIQGKRYYFGEDGLMVTGWLELGEDRFYLQEDGTAAVGPVEIDGRLWHFSPKGKQIYLVSNKYLLHDDYAPDIVSADRTKVDSSIVEPLERMLADCRAEGLHPVVISGYRSYWDQRYMYHSILNAQGAAGKLYCAVPNGSEHQLGLAVDIVGDSYRVLNASQEYTKTFQWFSEHCWEYGFIVRYPNGTTEITGIAYEPWHYRYVGVETAMELKELGITLEEYLGAA